MKWKCEICGFVATGDVAPEVCEVCGAGRESFVKAEDLSDENMKQWICLFCGYIYETAEQPKFCPECQVRGDVFVLYDPSKKQFEDAGEMWRCNACGYVVFGEKAPEECPVCGAMTQAFIKRSDWLKKR